MFCPFCGATNNDGNTFCGHCGRIFENKQTDSASIPIQSAESMIPQLIHKNAAELSQENKKEQCFAAIRKVFGSPLFLIAVIAFSINFLTNVLSIFNIPTYIYSLLPYELSGIAAEMSFKISYIVSIAVSLIPSLLLCIGHWLTYSAGRTKPGCAISNIGPKLLKVTYTIQLVFMYICVAILVLVFTLFSVLTFAMLEKIPVELYISVSVICVIVSAVYVLVFIYMHKVRTLASKLSYSFVNGTVFRGPSVYIIVAMFYSSVASISGIAYVLLNTIELPELDVLMFLTPEFLVLSVISSVCTVVYYVFSAITLIRLRRAFNAIDKN